MVFRAFGKCTGKTEIPPNCSLIPTPGIGITFENGITVISTIPPKVIPTVISVNKWLIFLIYKRVNQSVTNAAAIWHIIYLRWG